MPASPPSDTKDVAIFDRQRRLATLVEDRAAGRPVKPLA